ncbi:MAG TPA: DUF4932 domain-containing protein [Blastocatellia bacterium]|nr:DUF4932 domain-containing protein [Blastocatellia bacterium]
MRKRLLQHSFCIILGLYAPVVANSHSVSTPESGLQESPAVIAKVDPRVELMSIIARLAGFQEYVRNDFKLYADDVDKHFGKHKQHPAVQFAVKIRQSNGVSFDAVMFMAVHLNPPPALTPLVAFTDTTPERRWGREPAEEFVKLLQQFYKDADCEGFFKAHADLYRVAEERFQQLLNKVDFAWYKRFYGEAPEGVFNLRLGLLNGGGNYGPKVVYPDGKEDLYAIVGTWRTDSAGLPVYDAETLPTIIHEFNHSFVNHLVSARWSQFNAAGSKVYQSVADRMRNMAYGAPLTAIQESLVRAAALRYAFEHNAESRATESEMEREIHSGFIWMDELFALLGVYENSRSSFPTFRSFLPMIEGYYSDLAKRIEFKAAKFDELKPRVAAMAPFNNEAQDVDPGITQMTITFDKPMNVKGYSYSAGQAGEEHFPIEKALGFNEAGTAITLQLNLKSDWEYEFVVTGRSFRSKDGYSLRPYTVKFKTKKAVN